MVFWKFIVFLLYFCKSLYTLLEVLYLWCVLFLVGLQLFYPLLEFAWFLLTLNGGLLCGLFWLLFTQIWVIYLFGWSRFLETWRWFGFDILWDFLYTWRLLSNFKFNKIFFQLKFFLLWFLFIKLVLNVCFAFWSYIFRILIFQNWWLLM